MQHPKARELASDFRGRITLQDGVSYFVGATMQTALDGEDYLAIYLRPELRGLWARPTSKHALADGIRRERRLLLDTRSQIWTPLSQL